jgi:hypothetical protein
VVVYFSQQRPTSDVDRNRVRGQVVTIVEAEKPAHTSWWLK